MNWFLNSKMCWIRDIKHKIDLFTSGKAIGDRFPIECLGSKYKIVRNDNEFF